MYLVVITMQNLFVLLLCACMYKVPKILGALGSASALAMGRAADPQETRHSPAPHVLLVNVITHQTS